MSILFISIDTGLRESSLADDLSSIQNDFPEVDIGSYPYFNEKPGTILVLRSIDEVKIQLCNLKIKTLIVDLKKN